MPRRVRQAPQAPTRYVLKGGDWAGEVCAIVDRPRPGLVRVDLVRLPGLRLTCGDDRLMPA